MLKVALTASQTVVVPQHKNSILESVDKNADEHVETQKATAGKSANSLALARAANSTPSSSCAPHLTASSQQHLRHLPPLSATHLHLQGRCLECGAAFERYDSLHVVYMYNNRLSGVPNFQKSAATLTHLYLQSNQITRMRNFQALVQLKKLSLAFNRISVLEGLDALHELEELDMEHQQLAEGEALVIDSRSMAAIGNALEVLNISCNRLGAVSTLRHLHQLRVLQCADNCLTDKRQLVAVLRQLPLLAELNLIRNPVVRSVHAQNDIILACTESLQTFNEKPVTENTKQFLRNRQSRILSDDAARSQHLFLNENSDFGFARSSAMNGKSTYFPKFGMSHPLRTTADSVSPSRQAMPHRNSQPSRVNIVPSLGEQSSALFSHLHSAGSEPLVRERQRTSCVMLPALFRRQSEATSSASCLVPPSFKHYNVLLKQKRSSPSRPSHIRSAMPVDDHSCSGDSSRTHQRPNGSYIDKDVQKAFDAEREHIKTLERQAANGANSAFDRLAAKERSKKHLLVHRDGPSVGVGGSDAPISSADNDIITQTCLL